MMESALKDTFRQRGLEQKFFGFRELVGNDEIIFETYGISMPSLVRCPYPEYHCDRDTISIIHQDRLSESLDVLLEVVNRIENETYIRKKFDGLLCLSNPDYDLYVDPGQPAFGKKGLLPLRKLMEYMFLMRHGDFLSMLCERIAIKKDVALKYLKRWEKLDLVDII